MASGRPSKVTDAPSLPLLPVLSMNTLEFIAALIQALAWPATVLAIAVVLRAPLGKLLTGDVRRWKAGPAGVEVEYWDQRTKEVRQEVADAAGDAKLVGADESMSLSKELEELADVSPRSAILESYSRIEQQLRSLLKSDGVDQRRPLGGRGLARLAGEKGLIGPETVDAIEGLTVLRNLAAHGEAPSDLDRNRALEYAALTDAVLYAMTRAHRRSPP
jgi:hypothetical protein